MTERMSDERVDREIRDFLAWQAEDVAGAPSAGEVAGQIIDREGTARARLRLTPKLAWALLAGLLVITLLGALVTGGNRPSAPAPLGVVDDITPSSVAEPTRSHFPSPAVASPQAVSPTSASVASPSLPALGHPGTTASAAGDYSWDVGLHSNFGLPVGAHKVTGGPGGVGVREVVSMSFRGGSDCLKASQEQQVPVRVAGFDGVVVEPYEPPVPFGSPDGIEITRAYQLIVGGRHLCVYVTWHPTTTDEEHATAVRILDTLLAEPVGEDGVRVVVTLDAGWDTG